MNKFIERHIEQELYDYHKNKLELEQIKNDICEESPAFEEGMPRGTDCGNPTESKGLRIATSRDILWLERRIRAIEKVLSIFKNDKTMLDLIENKYFKRELTDIGVAKKLNIGTTTYYRKRRRLLEELKIYLGW